MAHSRALPFGSDVARQIAFEADARREGILPERHADPAVVTYRFAIEVPVHYDERGATVIVGESVPRDVNVKIDGPVCTRHRFLDGSLCMWWGRDSEASRWRIGDGLLTLIGHIKLHAWCEADCRAGRPWPKEEAPGDHPRRPDCPTCAGLGA
jgi:hypothetical protein